MRIIIIGWLILLTITATAFATSTDYAMRTTVRAVRVVVLQEVSQ